MKRVPYTYYECEEMANAYDQQVPLKAIADQINYDFHGGNPVRNVNSVWYGMKLYEEDKISEE
jgi:hypothetical protein